MIELRCYNCNNSFDVRYFPTKETTVLSCSPCGALIEIRGRIGFSILEKKEKTNGVSN